MAACYGRSGSDFKGSVKGCSTHAEFASKTGLAFTAGGTLLDRCYLIGGKLCMTAHVRTRFACFGLAFCTSLVKQGKFEGLTAPMMVRSIWFIGFGLSGFPLASNSVRTNVISSFMSGASPTFCDADRWSA
jgi:hypothetical protein